MSALWFLFLLTYFGTRVGKLIAPEESLGRNHPSETEEGTFFLSGTCFLDFALFFFWDEIQTILLKLFTKLKGDEWIDKTFWFNETTPDFCTWSHVLCNEENNISGFNFESNNLDGNLKDCDLEKLTELTFLQFQRNPKLIGSIPESILTLSKLVIFSFVKSFL